MIDHESKGALKKAKATVKETVGHALGSEKLETAARIEKADAEAERRYGEAAKESDQKGVKPYTF